MPTALFANSQYVTTFVCLNTIYLPRLSSWLHRGALMNVDAPGCCTSMVPGLTGHQYEGFRPGVQLYLKVSSLKVPPSRRI